MMATSALASCLANGLGALCDPTATPAFARTLAGFSYSGYSGYGGGSALGSTASSLYGSSSSSGSGSGSSREASIGSLDLDISEMLQALNTDLLLEADADTACSRCEAGVPAARCSACNLVLCTGCAGKHQRQMTKDHVLIRVEDGLPFNLAVPPPHLAMTTAPRQTVRQARVSPPPRKTVTPPRPRPGTLCELHAGEALTAYCETCGTGMCNACSSTGLHRGHAVVKLSAAKAATEKALRDATTGAQQTRDRLEQASSVSAAVEAKALQVHAEIRRCSRELIAAVEARERELLGNLNDIRQLKGRSLQLQADVLRGLHERYVRLAESLKDTLAHGQGVDVVHARDKAAVELAQLRAAKSSSNGAGRASHAVFEDDVMSFIPPEPVLASALSSMGCVSSSGYALSTVAAGEGLTRAVRGRPASFTVQVKSHLEAGVAVVPAGELDVVLVAPEGGVTRAVIRGDLEDRGDGSFGVTYRPRAEGVHTLSVTLRGRHIVGSPFQVEVRALRDYNSVRAAAVEFGGEGAEEGRFLRPWGVCTDKSGRVIVADRSNNRVQVFREDGQFVFAFGSHGSEPGQFDRPAGVAADAQGRIVVADKDNHRIQVFSPEGHFIKTFGKCGSKPGEFSYPWDVDVNAAGEIVVADTKNHRIQLFSADGVFLRKYGWETSPTMWRHFETPRGVAFTKQGYVIVSDFDNHRLVVVEPTLRHARFLGCEGSGPRQFLRPQGVAIDTDGCILISDSRNNRIQVLEEDGRFKTEIALDMDRPSGITVTGEGKIIVVDFGHNRVLVL